jgi:ribosome-associated heat shock protein Hsp15
MNEAQQEPLRIDKWLWAARFFKTRGLASKAVSGGHVQKDGQRMKPSKVVQVGEVFHIRRGQEQYVVRVLALSPRRGPASEAALLYEESEESKAQRASQREDRRLVQAAATRPEGRPDKRDRKKIRQFIRKE